MSIDKKGCFGFLGGEGNVGRETTAFVIWISGSFSYEHVYGWRIRWRCALLVGLGWKEREGAGKGGYG